MFKFNRSIGYDGMITNNIFRTLFIFAFIIISVGCTEESNDDQQSNTDQYKFETTDELAALGVTLTKVGSPVWQPTEFRQFSAKIGSADNGFADVGTFAQCFFSAGQTGKNFSTESGVSIPEREHPNSYFDFIDESIKACGHVDKSKERIFSAADFKAPNGVFYTFNIVPIEGLAPVGKSPYNERELIIPNSKFPITIDGGFWKNGEELDPDFDGSSPSMATLKYSGSNDSVVGDGYPHIPKFFVESYEFVKNKVPENEIPGVYELKLEIRDAEQSGWTVTMTSTLQ